MIDIETRKQLFKDYSNCKWLQVSKEGKVVCCSGISIECVSIDKDGNVYVDWRTGAYSQLKTAEVNVVNSACGDCIQGIFTSKEEAVDITKEWFKIEKLEKIKQLEEELAELKKDI